MVLVICWFYGGVFGDFAGFTGVFLVVLLVLPGWFWCFLVVILCDFGNSVM